VAMWRGSVMTRSFATWHEHASYQRHMARVAIKITLRWQNRAMATSYSTWQMRASEQRRLAQLGAKVAQRFINRTLTSAWATWQVSAAQQRKMERTAVKVVRRMANRLLTKAWQMWLGVIFDARQSVLSMEYDQLKALLEGMVPKMHLVAAQEELNQLRLELNEIVRSVMPGDLLDNSQDQIAQLKSLQRSFHRFTSKVKTELGEISQVLEEFVPRSELTKKEVELRALSLECTRFKYLVQDMVPKERLNNEDLDGRKSSTNRERSMIQFDKTARDEVQRCSEELEQLKKTMVPKRRLDDAEYEIANLRSEVMRLQNSTQGTPLHKLDQSLNDMPDASRSSQNKRQEHIPCISFTVPAAGLAMGQAGRLAPFMMQVTDLCQIKWKQ
jgi:hypothetical protein